MTPKKSINLLISLKLLNKAIHDPEEKNKCVISSINIFIFYSENKNSFFFKFREFPHIDLQF